MADDAGAGDVPPDLTYDRALDELVQSTLAAYGELWQALVGAAGVARTESERAVVVGFITEIELRFAELATKAGGGRIDGRWPRSA